MRFTLSGGQQHDMTEAGALIAGLAPKFVVADKAYDSDPLRNQIRRQGARSVIPSRQRHRRRRHDRKRYRLRNVVERFIRRLPTRGRAIRKNRPQLPRHRHPRRLLPSNMIVKSVRH